LGNVLHALFSTIRTADDIEPKLKELELEGIIYDEQITADSLRKKLTTALSDPRVKEWFSPQWTIYNECTILRRNSRNDEVEERRPDRVMYHNGKTIVVDFKFGVPQREHQDQVRSYMSLLQQMGNEHVEGYLWYVLKNEIKEVK
jgi:CRISPR/Cas system-associated exonuclease Cas4 (RecB family)